ncbi:MAG: replicative DNA helicase, partial [Chitinophagaceae bacterium]
NEYGESNRGETNVRIAKHRNGSLETIKLRALLHIQKFVEDDFEAGGPPAGAPIPPGFRPVSGGDASSKLYIEKSSRMNEMNDFDEETPF